MMRDVLIEAGHRCAIPACGQTTVEIAHIVPWKEVKDHTFDNLIALCPTCHTRSDKGDIDRKAMQQYKANLSVVTGRYGHVEQRVLRFFSDQPGENEISLADGFDILVMYLVQDGLLEDTGKPRGMRISGVLFAWAKRYRLTDKGRDFINKWLSAERLE
jgi:hypothetical protein